ncbi:MAG TPA: metal ABC transporter ATP-binding protein [Alicyclobacillus sp.]|nr:metal ABC transporter ATP-binding protein [Alicyclobacillus sp.]
MSAIVRLENVHAAYGQEPILTDVAAEAAAGERVAVVGPNGAGKSTLLKVLLGLVPHVIGHVEVAGQSVTPGHPPSGAAYVPQSQVMGLDMPVTVWDVAAMGLLRRGFWPKKPGPKERAEVARALVAVDMLEWREELFGNLSGGQRQRVLIARALIRNAPVWLLDEPVTGLDAPTQEVIEHLIDGLRTDGVAIIQVTHDLEPARLRQFDQVWCINRRLVGRGSFDEVQKRGILADTFGVPIGKRPEGKEGGGADVPSGALSV